MRKLKKCILLFCVCAGICVVFAGCSLRTPEPIDCSEILDSIGYVPSRNSEDINDGTYAVSLLPWGTNEKKFLSTLDLKKSDLLEVPEEMLERGGCLFTRLLQCENPDAQVHLYCQYTEEGSWAYGFYFFLDTPELAKAFCLDTIAAIDARMPEALSRSHNKDSWEKNLREQWIVMSDKSHTDSYVDISYVGDARNYPLSVVGTKEEECYLVIVSILDPGWWNKDLQYPKS